MRLVLVMLGGAVIVMAACPSASAICSDGTMAICYCGPCGDYDDTYQCDGGSCDPEDGYEQRCYFVVPEPQAGEPGEWWYSAGKNCTAYACDDPNDGNNCITDTDSDWEIAVVTYDWAELPTFLKGLCNECLADRAGIEFHSNGAFANGLESTSEYSKEHGPCSVSAPPCGQKKRVLSIFDRSEHGLTEVTFKLQVQCWEDSEVCWAWHDVDWDTEPCIMEAHLTVDSEDTTSKCTTCEQHCPWVHTYCEGSSTSTGPCDYLNCEGEEGCEE